jgi:hypothetical protein
MAERQRLSVETLEEILPGEVMKIGKQDVFIKPLGLLKLATISRKLKAFFKELQGQGINLDNAKTPENIILIASELLENFPTVLEEASNIHLDDINLLPIETVVELVDKIIDVNMKSNESFLGNLNRLTSKFALKKGQNKKSKKDKKKNH